VGKNRGLFNSHIRTVYEDSKGYVWIGSSDGLMRYDGVVFDLFRRNINAVTTLSDNTINCIIEDQNDYVFWIGTALGGINRFDIVRNEYKNYIIQADSTNSSGIIHINAIHQIDSTKFLVGTHNQGMYYFYPGKNKIINIVELIDFPYGLPKRIRNVVKGEKFIWAPTDKGIMQFSPDGNFMQMLYFNGSGFVKKPEKRQKHIVDLLELDSDHLVFTSHNVLYKLDWRNNKLDTLYQVPGKLWFNFIEKDNAGSFWVGSARKGLYYFDFRSNKVNHFNTVLGVDLEGNQIKDLLLTQDKSILWIAARKGLFKYDYNKVKFEQFDLADLTRHMTIESYMLAKDSKDGYWFWSKEGFFHKPKEKKFFINKFNTPHIPHATYFKAVEDKNENMWFATDNGLLRYNLKGQYSKNYIFKKAGFESSQLNLITNITLSENDNVLWLSNAYGLIEFDKTSGKYTVYPIETSFRYNKSNHLFTSIEFTKDNKYLWMSSRAGILYQFNVVTKQFECYELKNFSNDSQPYVILDIELDYKGNIWLATYGSGLVIFHPKSNTISNEVALDILESYAYSIVADDMGNMWISTNMGIARVNSFTKEVTNFKEDDGTFCNEFNEASSYKTKDGRILFGGMKGFVEFDPNNMSINNYDAPIHISAFLTEENNALYSNFFFEDVSYINDTIIEIPRSQSTIKFHVSTLNFSQSHKNKICYKLEGFDKKWREDYSHNILMYSNLKPGNYRLVVQGINNDGVKSSTPAYLHIKIPAHYYETLGFKITIAILIVFVVILSIRLRFSWHRAHEKILSHMVSEKTHELSEANKELAASKEEILAQKTELEVHRNYLEDLVKARTIDLEVAKKKAEDSDRLKTAFLANLSHEIRTPMNAIIGFSSLLQADGFDEGQKKEHLKVIGQSSESLLVLIDDIIDISRIETGNIQLVNNNTHIPSLIKEVLDELYFEEKSEEVSFVQHFDLMPEDSNIFIDRQKLKQVISNLLRNAFKFTQNGTVKLRVKSAKISDVKALGFRLNGSLNGNLRPVLFTVEDTGIGIADEDMQMIFEPFQKAKNGRKFYKGMGLGLSIVRNYITLFGGDIIATSEPGKGSTFHFYVNKSLQEIDVN
jgi:signal transduction histidine kinase/ligand-binding sensor domain-containing protein